MRCLIAAVAAGSVRAARNLAHVWRSRACDLAPARRALVPSRERRFASAPARMQRVRGIRSSSARATQCSPLARGDPCPGLGDVAVRKRWGRRRHRPRAEGRRRRGDRTGSRRRRLRRRRSGRVARAPPRRPPRSDGRSDGDAPGIEPLAGTGSRSPRGPSVAWTRSSRARGAGLPRRCERRGTPCPSSPSPRPRGVAGPAGAPRASGRRPALRADEAVSWPPFPAGAVHRRPAAGPRQGQIGRKSAASFSGAWRLTR